MKKHVKNKLISGSILKGWAISYMIVLLIPLIAVMVNYAINVRTIKQEILKANELTLDNIGDNIDGMLEAAKGFYTFAVSNEYYEMLQYHSTINNQFYYDVNKLYSALADYRRTGSLDVHCMVSRNDLEFIVTEKTTGKFDIYYNTLAQYNDISFDFTEWKGVLNRIYSNNFFVGWNLVDGKSRQSLYFANTPRNVFQGSITLLTAVPLDEIAELTEYMSKESYFLLHIDGEPVVAFSAGEVVEIPQIDEHAAANGDWISLSEDSSEKKISYSLVYSDAYYLEILSYTRRMFMVSVILTILFGIMGIAILLQHNYRPIYHLLRETGEGETEGNEIQKIEETLKRLKGENMSTMEQLHNHKQALAGNWLLSMMKGRTTSLQIREREVDFSFGTDSSISMVGFSIPVSDKSNSIMYDELLFFIVDNIFSELMKGQNFYRVEDGRFLLYLFDHQENADNEWQTKTLEKVEYLCSLLEEKWNTRITGVVSDAEHEFSSVKVLYRRMMETFEYNSVVGGFGAINMLLNNSEDNSWLEYLNGELNSAMKAGNLERCREVTAQFFEMLSEMSVTVFRMYVFEAFNIVINIFKEYESDVVSRAEVYRYAEMLMQSGAEETQSVFEDLINYVGERIALQVREEGRSVVRKIQEHVITNYRDHSLNIAAISADIQRNPKYISRVFKEETGEGILDYINKYRIMKAKELMSTYEYTLEEISLKVGYSNIRSFRRAFIKITGEMPSEYRKQKEERK